jgi:hypothetical protein
MNALLAFNIIAKAYRKIRRPRRFDRVRASKPLLNRVKGYWDDGLDSLFAYLGERDRWDAIQRHCQLHAVTVEQSFQKVLSDADRKMLLELLSGFDYFNDVEKQAGIIVKACYLDTFEEAATFALKQLGHAVADFELKNESIREFLLSRKSAAVFSTRSHIDQVMDSIVQRFYEAGRNPYDQQLLDALKRELHYKTDYEAQRFALTETAITCEKASLETFQRNGVQRKRWNINGVNTRPSHQELSQVEVGIDEKFDVGGYPAAHPCDSSLPAEELVNCHCWLEPVVSDEFQLDPAKVWEGQ